MFGQGSIGGLALGQPSPRTYTLSAGAGSLALTSYTISFVHTYVLNAGQPATPFTIAQKKAATPHLYYMRYMNAAAGAIHLTGQNAVIGRELTLHATAGSYTLTPQDASDIKGWVSAYGSFSLSPQTANLHMVKRIMNAAPGDFTYTGQPATLLMSHLLAAASRALTLSPTTVTLTFTRQIAAAPGAFTLEAGSANLLEFHKLYARAGGFTIGQPGGLGTWLEYMPDPYRELNATRAAITLYPKQAQLRRLLSLAAAPGSYALTGSPANLAEYTGTTLIAFGGVFHLTPSSASFARSYVLSAAQGSVTLAPQTAGSIFQHKMSVAPGAFSVAPQTVALNETHQTTAASRALTINGAATMVYTRQITPAAAALTLTGGVAYDHIPPLQAVAGNFSFVPQTASLLVSRQIQPAAGRYVFNGTPDVRQLAPLSAVISVQGKDANFVYNWTPLGAAQGAFALTPGSAALSKIYTLSAAPGAIQLRRASVGDTYVRAIAPGAGAFALAPQAATLTLTHTMQLAAGNFALEPETANLAAQRRMDPLAGAFVLTGNPVSEVSADGTAFVTVSWPGSDVQIGASSVTTIVSTPDAEALVQTPTVEVEIL